MTIVSSIDFPLGHISTYRSINATLYPFLYNAEIESKFFFKHGTYKTSIITIMALASMMKWSLHQIDVKTTFLNGVIEEEVYIEQPHGFEVEDKWTHICKLRKDLYGLNQAHRSWYGMIDRFSTTLGFTKSKSDPKIYFKVMDDEPVILFLYDVFLTGNEKLIVEFKKNLSK